MNLRKENRFPTFLLVVSDLGIGHYVFSVLKGIRSLNGSSMEQRYYIASYVVLLLFGVEEEYV